MKDLVKMITPPFVWEGIKRIVKGKKSEKFTFNGHYPSFQDVFRCYPQATNYHSEESENIIIESAFKALRKFENNKISDFGWETFRLNVLPTVMAGLPNFAKSEQIKICDVGGGLGTLYLNLCVSCKRLSFKITVIELAETAKAGQLIYQHYNNVQFISEFPENTEHYDLVYFGSSLQYFENYEHIIESVCAYGPSTIVLTDLPMSRAETFVCAQINMANRAIPVMVINIDELMNLFEKFGYEACVTTKSYYPFHDLSNMQKFATDIDFYNLFFTKKEEV